MVYKYNNNITQRQVCSEQNIKQTKYQLKKKQKPLLHNKLSVLERFKYVIYKYTYYIRIIYIVYVSTRRFGHDDAARQQVL